MFALRIEIFALGAIESNRSFLWYSFLPHGDTSAGSADEAWPGPSVLSELRTGSKRSADLRRLLLRHLSALRNSPGIA